MNCLFSKIVSLENGYLSLKVKKTTVVYKQESRHISYRMSKILPRHELLFLQFSLRPFYYFFLFFINIFIGY